MSGAADKLAAAKLEAQAVLEAWPEEAYGSGKLEQAVALMGECVDELERARGRAGGWSPMSAGYRPVLPREHDPTCRRRIDGVTGDGSGHVALDREGCERCRNLWARLDDARERREYVERHTCAHHGVLDCETCRDRDLEARGT